MEDEENNRETLECARYGEDEDLLLLLQAGASSNYQDPETGNTALHKAAANGNVGCLKILIDHGSKHVPNNQGNYPTHWAAQNAKVDALKLLVERFPDIDMLAKNSFGRSTLTEAFNSKDVDCIEVCLSHPSAAEEKLIPSPSPSSQPSAPGAVPLGEESASLSTHKEGEAGSEMATDNKDAVTHTFCFSPSFPSQETTLETSAHPLNKLYMRELYMTRADHPFGSAERPEDDTTGLALWSSSVLLARWVAVNAHHFRRKRVGEVSLIDMYMNILHDMI